MDKAYVRTMQTNPTISEHQEVHISDPYRDTIKTHCLQRRHQSWLHKNKNYPWLKTIGEPKTSQGTTWSYRILQEIHKILFRYDLSTGITAKRRSGVRLDRGMQYIIWNTKKEVSRSTHSKISKMVDQIPCTHRRIRPGNRKNPNSTRRWWNGLPYSLQQQKIK